MSWLPEHAAGATSFEEVFALRPELFAAWRAFATQFWTRSLLDPNLLELARIRIGQMHGAELPDLCDAMRAARAALPRAKADALAAWWRNEGTYSETERACLRFAEQFVLDAKGITDAEAGAVVGALGDAGTVAFVELLAVLDGFSRFARILDVGATPAPGAPA
jgi:alkylhydroperoxidase family enzyme